MPYSTRTLEFHHSLQGALRLQRLPGRRDVKLDDVQIVGAHAGQALFYARQDIVAGEDMRAALAARGWL